MSHSVPVFGVGVAKIMFSWMRQELCNTGAKMMANMVSGDSLYDEGMKYYKQTSN